MSTSKFIFVLLTAFALRASAQLPSDYKNEKLNFDDGDETFDIDPAEEAERQVVISLPNADQEAVFSNNEVIAVSFEDFKKLKVVNKDFLIKQIEKTKSKNGFILKGELISAFEFITANGSPEQISDMVDILAYNKVDLNNDANFDDKFHSAACAIIFTVEREAFRNTTTPNTDDEGHALPPQVWHGFSTLDKVIQKMKVNPATLTCIGKSFPDYLDYVIKTDFEDAGASLSEIKRLKKIREQIGLKYFGQKQKQESTNGADPNLKINEQAHEFGDIRVIIEGNQLSTACKAEVVQNLMNDAVARFKTHPSKENLELFNLNEKGKFGGDSHCVGQMRLYRVDTNKMANTNPVSSQKPTKSKAGSKQQER